MITITCPNDNVPERRYVMNVLFNHLLNCNLQPDCIHFDSNADSYIIRKANKTIEIEDHFFRHYASTPLEYLSEENIPAEVSTFHALGQEIPIVYGKDSFYQDNEIVKVGLDIFGSTFFLLSHWEDISLGREKKGFIPESELFICKHNLCHRAIVHEYEMLLAKLLDIPRRHRDFKVVLTHDVEELLSYRWANIVKGLFIGLKKHDEFKVWKKNLKYKLYYPTEYTQFFRYITLGQKYKVEEYFFVKVCAKGERGATYTYDDKVFLRVVRRLRLLRSKGVRVGFHPSQSTFNNRDQWDAEVARFRDILPPSEDGGICGRNHFLLSNSAMLRQWESMSSDSERWISISNRVLRKSIGFRSSIAVPFPVFDVLHRRELNLYEVPCEIMDTAMLPMIIDTSEESVMADVFKVIDEVKKYDGQLVLNWHLILRTPLNFKNCLRLCDRIFRHALNG